jgi:hypothetical protein
VKFTALCVLRLLCGSGLSKPLPPTGYRRLDPWFSRRCSRFAIFLCCIAQFANVELS